MAPCAYAHWSSYAAHARAGDQLGRGEFAEHAIAVLGDDEHLLDPRANQVFELLLDRGLDADLQPVGRVAYADVVEMTAPFSGLGLSPGTCVELLVLLRDGLMKQRCMYFCQFG